MTIQLAIENRQARPERYEGARYRKASWAGRSMVMSGLIVLCFVIFHILHFTADVDPAGLREPAGDASRSAPNGMTFTRMVVLGLPAAGGELLLYSGDDPALHAPEPRVRQLCPDARANSTKLAPWLVNGGRALAVIICLGYIAIPIAVMTGFLHL